MKLQTQVKPTTYPFSLDYGQPILALGSCFAEEVARRLQDNKFTVCVNPWGILYNPISVARFFDAMAGDYEPELFHHEGLWRSFDHHGDCAHPERQQARHLCSRGRAEFRNGKRLLLTLGSAHVFENRDRVVANCHRLPQSQFQRRRLEVAEVIARLGPALRAWLEADPERQALVTVSPVRYLRDGLIESQRSKAVLLLAVEQLCQQLPRLHYFPAYEILLDELRDYRFYARDMAHPSELAIEIIWERVQQSLLSSKSRQLLAELAGILSAANHRPRHGGGEATRRFAETQLAKLAQLTAAHPELNLKAEQQHFLRLLDGDVAVVTDAEAQAT